jgi:DNA-binding XRE family transcriptional regulator
MTVGEFFRSLRQSKNLTQTGLTKVSGVSRRSIQRIETDTQTPSLSTANALLCALNKR